MEWLRRFVFMGCLVVMLTPALSPALAQDRLVRIYVPSVVLDTGLMGFIGPRFTLKTQVRIDLVTDPTDADLVLGSQGRPVFDGLDRLWHIAVQTPDHPASVRFEDWLTSDIGQRTIQSFAPEGVPVFGPVPIVIAPPAPIVITEAVRRGQAVAQAKCSRCHQVEPGTGFGGIGSTPSFMVLRTLSNWETRFAGFFALNPHPAFTQLEGVTAPFPINRPSPIIPVEMTLEQLDDMMAYVATIEAADLGAPLQHQ